MKDASSNVVTSDHSDAVSLAITSGTGTAGATLSCTANPVTVSAGVATFSCSIDKAGSSYTLTATSGTLTPATSTSFAIQLLAANPSGIIGLNSVSIGASKAVVDSFNSSLGSYSSTKGSAATVLGNGTVTLGGAKVYGDVRSTQGSVVLQSGSLVTGNVAAGSTISNSGGTIQGTVTPYSPSPALAPPAVSRCSPYSADAGIGGKYTYDPTTGNLTVSSGNTVTLANGTYCFNTVTLSGGRC